MSALPSSNVKRSAAIISCASVHELAFCVAIAFLLCSLTIRLLQRSTMPSPAGERPYISAYFAMKRAVRTYMIQWMRLKFPAQALITVYAMTPNMMPSDIE